jgi:uncharacterized membrane protein
MPFMTGWMGENGFKAIPVAAYGVVLLFMGLAFVILTRSLIVHHGRESLLAKSIRGDRKGKISVAMYAIAIPLAFVDVWLSCAIYVAVAAMWIIPDPRIERTVS